MYTVTHSTPFCWPYLCIKTTNSSHLLGNTYVYKWLYLNLSMIKYEIICTTLTLKN